MIRRHRGRRFADPTPNTGEAARPTMSATRSMLHDQEGTLARIVESDRAAIVTFCRREVCVVAVFRSMCCKTLYFEQLSGNASLAANNNNCFFLSCVRLRYYVLAHHMSDDLQLTAIREGQRT
jgi:hypothetical protein